MYDIFLAGPWEQYASEQYKTLVRAAFAKDILMEEKEP
jgi:hypothetical protein